MSLPLIDLSQVTPPAFRSDLDFERTLEERLARFRELMTAAGLEYLAEGLESDPAVILQQADAYREMLALAALNDTYLATLLAFAQGADLDHLGVTLHLLQRMPEESDSRYRNRIVLAAQQKSGGRLTGYELEALSLTVDVTKAQAFVDRSTGEPIVRVAVMAEENPAAPELVARVQAHLDRRDVRQATDIVVAQPVTVIPADVEIVLLHFAGPTPAVLKERAHEALERAIALRRAPGRALPRSALIAAAAVDGVERVKLLVPEEDILAAPGDLVDVESVTIVTELIDV